MSDEPVLKFDPDWVVAPGDTLAEWCEENKLPPRVAAVACGKMPPERFQGIIDGEVRITETDAEALAHGTGIPAYLWLNLERAFRVGLAAGKVWTR